MNFTEYKSNKEGNMLTFEVINELTLKVTCEGNDTLIAKAGAFIAGENPGGKNYTFEKMLLGPGGSIGQALLGQLVRRVAGENIPLMKVSVESENILAFTNDCDYSVRFLGVGVLSQKGLATTTLVGRGNNAYVALLSDGNPLVVSNVKSRDTLAVDPDAVICWFSKNGMGDPQIKADISWKTFIGQASGESYSFEWSGNEPVTVLVQPSERGGGIRVSVD